MKTLLKSLFFSVALLALFLVSPARASEIETHFEFDPSLPIVYLNVAVKAGSAHDLPGESGIGNFVGEMMMRGTSTRSKAMIDEALDLMGATLSVETRSEAIIFRGRVLSSRLSEYMEILQDILVNPSFPELEIKKLKSEIISAITEQRGKDNSLAKVLWEGFLFSQHPYSNPILGKTKDIQNLTRKSLLRHYSNLFQSRNLLVIGSGDSERSFVEAWAKRLGEKRPNSPGENPVRGVPAPSRPSGREILFVDKPDRTQTQLYFGQVGLRMTDPDFFPMHVANHVFGGGSFSARLMTEIRVKRGWSYGAYSYFRHGIQPRSWQAYTFPATKDTPAALGLIQQMLSDWKDRGITPEEFAFAQSSLVNSSGFTYNTPAKRVENLLLEKTLALPVGTMRSYGEKIARLKLEDVNSAIRRTLTPDRMRILIFGTEKQTLKESARALGVESKAIRVIPYTAE